MTLSIKLTPILIPVFFLAIGTYACTTSYESQSDRDLYTYARNTKSDNERMQNLQRLENKYRAQLRKSRSNKDRIVLYIQLGNLYEKMSQKTNMMKSFNKAFSLAGYNPMKQPGKCCSSLSMNDVLPKMAEYYMERNDWKKAYKLWDNWNLCGIDVCDFGTPWNITLRESKLAECLIQMGKYKEAIEVIEDCLYRRKDPCGCVCLSGSPYDNKLRELLISIGDLDK